MTPRGQPTFSLPFSGTNQTDVDSLTNKVHAPHILRSVLWDIHLQVSNT